MIKRCLSVREPHLDLSVGQRLPDDEPVPEVGPRVDPRRLEDLDAAARAPRLEVAYCEHQAPSGWKASCISDTGLQMCPPTVTTPTVTIWLYRDFESLRG